MSDGTRRVGLIVNPVAGLGGAAGLKGSDQPNLLELTAGRKPVSPHRALEALVELARMPERPTMIAACGEMGESVARSAELDVETVAFPINRSTSAADTIGAARAIASAGADLLMFVGGDGTAVDILEAVGGSFPVLGVPSGVKMHSGVFAVSPRAAAAVVRSFLEASSPTLLTGEVLDVDEDVYRDGRIVPRFHGTMTIPAGSRLVQPPKGRTAVPDRVQTEMLGEAVRDLMRPGVAYVFGPGSTTAAVLRSLGVVGTLIGVDVVRDQKLIAADVDDDGLERALGDEFIVVVSPIGGQGFVFGRGNQQISARVLQKTDRAHLMVIATEDKLVGLGGLPLEVDTGSTTVDAAIADGGYIRVLTGPGAWMVYPIEAVP